MRKDEKVRGSPKNGGQTAKAYVDWVDPLHALQVRDDDLHRREDEDPSGEQSSPTGAATNHFVPVDGRKCREEKEREREKGLEAVLMLVGGGLCVWEHGTSCSLSLLSFSHSTLFFPSTGYVKIGIPFPLPNFLKKFSLIFSLRGTTAQGKTWGTSMRSKGSILCTNLVEEQNGRGIR